MGRQLVIASSINTIELKGDYLETQSMPVEWSEKQIAYVFADNLDLQHVHVWKVVKEYNLDNELIKETKTYVETRNRPNE